MSLVDWAADMIVIALFFAPFLVVCCIYRKRAITLLICLLWVFTNILAALSAVGVG